MAAQVRVFNPSTARPRKKLTYGQVKKRQDRAAEFLDSVADDPDLSDEIEGLSVRQYAERKGFQITDNSTPRRKENSMVKRQDLNTTLQQLNDAASQLTTAAKRLGRANSNPGNGNGNGNGNGKAAKQQTSSDLDRVLNRVDTIGDLLADGDADGALDAVNDLLDDYDNDDNDDDQC